jgi:hypothetical protein
LGCWEEEGKRGGRKKEWDVGKRRERRKEKLG